MSRFGLGEGVMGFGGDDREFQRVASRVERTMRGIGGNVDFAINMSFLSRLASGLGNMGKAAEEMAAKVRLGKAEFTDLAEEVARNIPILGHFVTAGRAIRELITGEKSYTEVLKQQTEAQNERIKAVNGWIEAMKKLGRRQEDLGRELSPEGFAKDFSGIAASVARQTEDLPGQLEKEFEQQFKDFAAQRKSLGEKLQNLRDRNVSRSVSSGAVGGRGFVEKPDPQIEKDIASTERSIDQVDKKAQELRDKMAEVRQESQKAFEKSGFNRFADLLGENFSKGVRSAVTAVDSFIPRLPKLSSATQQAVDQAGGKLGEFTAKMAQFRADLGKGLINDRTFQQISFDTLNKTAGADFWKAAGEAIADGFSSFQAKVDPALGGLISNVRDQMSNLLRTFGIGPQLSPAGVPDAPKSFRASFTGLEDLGRNLQLGAASGDQTSELLKGMLDVSTKSFAEQQRQTDLLKTVGTVK